MTTGRAAVFVGPERLFELRDIGLPEVQPGALLVRVRLATICGSDVHTWLGRRPAPLPREGIILGHELVGDVATLGDGRIADGAGNSLAVGDRVVFPYFFPCGRCRWCLNGQPNSCPDRRLTTEERGVGTFPHFSGAFAEYCYVRPGQPVFRVPERLPDEWAAPAACAAAQALHGLREAELAAGETVLVQGAGGVGLSVAMLAKALGAGKVIVIDGSAPRLRQARALGAYDTIDMGVVSDGSERVSHVRELTDARGADLVVEVAGHAAAVAEGLQMVRNGGRYLTMGCITPGESFPLDPASLVWGNIRLLGVCHYNPRALNDVLQVLAALPDAVLSQPMVSHKYSLGEIDDAFRHASQASAGDRDEHLLRAGVLPSSRP